jgi:hypothetical protein
MNIFDKIKLADIVYKLYERRSFLMKNYKTTLAGIVGALAIWLPQLQIAMKTGKPDWGQLILGLAVLLFGALAKDFNVTGGTVAQDKGTTTPASK